MVSRNGPIPIIGASPQTNLRLQKLFGIEGGIRLFDGAGFVRRGQIIQARRPKPLRYSGEKELVLGNFFARPDGSNPLIVNFCFGGLNRGSIVVFKKVAVQFGSDGRKADPGFHNPTGLRLVAIV